MKIDKLWNCLIQLSPRYIHLTQTMTYNFLIEVIDSDNFEQNEFDNIDLQKLTIDIEKIIGKLLTENMLIVATEFCVTNEYGVDNKQWNAIDHLIDNHSIFLSKDNMAYLRSLYNSYLCIYKVDSIVPKKSFVLSNVIEKHVGPIRISHKPDNMVEEGDYVATRVLSFEQKQKAVIYKSQKPIIYKTSNSFLCMPKDITEKASELITITDKEMKKQKPDMSPEYILLIKKMWSKEILEQWYLYQLEQKASTKKQDNHTYH